MAINRIKVWASGDTLYAADLNIEFSNVCNNAVNITDWTTNIYAVSRLPGIDQAIPIDSSVYVAEDYEIPAGRTVEIGANSILEIG